MTISRITKKFVLVLVLSLAATTLWAAGQSGTTTSAEKRYVTDPTTGKVVVAPEYGGTLTFAVKREPPTTDPLYGSGASRGADGVAEKLGIVDWATDRDKFAPGLLLYFPLSLTRGNLAESWEIQDQTTFVFNIRQGVRWHDKAPMNGRELTAKDVEYNFHRMIGSGSGFTEKVEGFNAAIVSMPIESVTATDDRTVVFKLKQPQIAAIEGILTDWGSWIMPPEVIQQHGDVKDWRNLVGTGPWMLTDWVDGSSMTYAKNPSYWGFDEKYPGNRLPYLDGLTGLVMTDDATILSALRSGQLDYVGTAGVAEQLSLAEKASLERTNPDIALFPWSIRSENTMTFNMSRDTVLSQDVRARRAMQMALDLETINNTYFKGLAQWEPQGMLGPAVSGYFTPFEEWPADVQRGFMYDPEGAEKLLDEAGYPRGADGTRFKVELETIGSNDLDYRQLAVTFWDAIGIDVEISIVDGTTYGAHVREHSYPEMTDWIAANTFIHPNAVFSWAYSESAWAPPGLNDPEYDRLYEAVLNAAAIEENVRAAKAADMYLIENHIFLWGPLAPKYIAVQPWVAGFSGETSLGGDDRIAVFARLWFDQALKKEMGH